LTEHLELLALGGAEKKKAGERGGHGRLFPGRTVVPSYL